MKIYLAGKIAPKDWRQEVVHGLVTGGAGAPRGPLFDVYDWGDHASFDATIPWPVLPLAIFKVHDYTGPYFMNCTHGGGCFQGRSSHGVGADARKDEYPEMSWGCDGDAPTPPLKQVTDACIAAIKRSDLVFAWLDSPSAYGTLVELGESWLRGQGRQMLLLKN